MSKQKIKFRLGVLILLQIIIVNCKRSYRMNLLEAEITSHDESIIGVEYFKLDNYKGVNYLNSKCTVKSADLNKVDLKVNVYTKSNGKLNTVFEIHKTLCDFIKTDVFFYKDMPSFGNFPRACPIEVMDYHMYNYTVNVNRLPASLPFTKWYANIDFMLDKKSVCQMKIILAIEKA